MFLLACWVLSLDDSSIKSVPRFNNPTVIRLAGVLLVLLSCIISAINIKRLLSSKPGLILNENGILDCSGLISEIIPWSNITGVNLFEVHNEKMVAIQVINPEKYLEGGNPVKLSLRREYFKICGSPFAITPATLNVDINSLINTLLSNVDKYGKRSNAPTGQMG